MSETQSSSSEGQRAVEIFLATRSITTALGEQLDDIEAQVRGTSFEDALGQFVLEHLDKATSIVDIPLSAELEDAMKRNATDEFRNKLLRETWHHVVETNNTRLQEILGGKSVKATLLPGAESRRAFRVLYGGGSATSQSGVKEVTGDVISANSNSADLFLHNEEDLLRLEGNIGSVRPSGWHVNVIDLLTGEQLVSLDTISRNEPV